MNHTSTTWDVTAQVFWKGLLREYNGEMYLRLVLRDEEGTKMEAVAFGSHCEFYDNIILKGHEYDFIGGFWPSRCCKFSAYFLHSDRILYCTVTG
ncbi:hypothetical protein BS78_01G325800 [Paspalum vaginatum]|nr:hypothetical protein BS78_01G325800 [Paspalum vaginatum]